MPSIQRTRRARLSTATASQEVIPEGIHIDIYSNDRTEVLGYVVGNNGKSLAALVQSPVDFKVHTPASVFNEYDDAILALQDGTGQQDDSIPLQKLTPEARNAIAEGGEGSGYTDPITADIEINVVDHKGKTLNLQNENDITITVPVGLGANMNWTFDKVSGNGQVFFDFSSVVIVDDKVFVKTDADNLAIGGYRAISENVYGAIPGSDLELNTAPVSTNPTTSTSTEGQTSTITPNITDAEGDNLDVPEFMHVLYDNDGSDNAVDGTESTISTAQGWLIPDDGSVRGKVYEGRVLPKATEGVKTGVWTPTVRRVITAAPVSNLWLPTNDLTLSEFWISSLEGAYNNTAGTTAAVLDDPVNGAVRGYKDRIANVLGTSEDAFPLYQTVDGSPAFVFTGDAQLNFGNILNSVVNQSSAGDQWAITVLVKLLSIDIATNFLVHKKSNDLGQGMAVRLNGNRRKVQLADNEVNDFGRQTGTFDNIVGTYCTTFLFTPGDADVNNICAFYDAGQLQANNPGGAPAGSGLSGGGGDLADFIVGGLGETNYALYELAISKNPTTDYVRRCESAFAYRHGMENSLVQNDNNTAVIGTLIAGHPYQNAAPTIS